MADRATAGVHAFLRDGQLRRTAPAVILVGTPDEAVNAALLIHAEGLPGFVAPASAEAGFQALAAETSHSFDRNQALAFCQELREGGHWLLVQNAERLFDATGGLVLLDVLCDAIALAELPFVAAATSVGGIARLHAEASRFVGLARTFAFGEASALVASGELVYLVSPAVDGVDVGWVVVVRVVITVPINEHATNTAPDADGALQLVDSLNLLGDRHLPTGIMITFRGNAFTASDQQSVFAAAEAVARRAVGRPLGPGESVEARRAVFYT